MTWRFSRFSSWAWRFLPGATAAVLVATLCKLAMLAPLERVAYQSLFRLRGPRPWDDRLVLIAIDDASLAQLGQFPWSRQRYVELLAKMTEAGASVVAVDLIWSEATPEDPALAEAINNYGPVILSQARDAQGIPLRPVPNLEAVGLLSGHVLYDQDPDGIARTLITTADGAPAFSLATLQAYSAIRERVLPPLEQPLWFNWVAPADTLTQYAFTDILQGRVPAAAFTDKIVLVGVTAVGFDPLNTPFDQDPPTYGVYLHATAINNGLQQSFLKPVGWRPGHKLGVIGTILITGPLLSGLLSRRQLRSQLFILLALNAGWCLLSMVLFQQNWLIPVATPILLIGTTAVVSLVSEEVRENIILKDQIEQLWQRYHEDLDALDNRLIEPIQPDLPVIGPSGSIAYRISQLTVLADQLGQSQSVQMAIARSIPIGLLAANLGGRVWFCNPPASTLLDIRPGASVFYALVPNWVSHRDWSRIIQQLKAGRSPKAKEVCLTDRWFELRWQPIAYRQQTGVADTLSPDGFLLFIEDITPRKQVETVLREAKEAAEDASLAKSNFLATMSHELRTPLNAILGFSDLMGRDQILSAEHQDYLDVINRSGRHLLGLINNVLDMAKIESGRLELREQAVNIHQLLDELHRMLLLKADRQQIALVFERDANVPQAIRADESKLRQILLNLLGNAIKFTHAGHVVLRVRAAEANTTAHKDAPVQLAFEVEDTGLGIAKTEIARLFQPFEQTATGQQTEEGTGLGLTISRQFIQLMGGDITVTSELGKGTIFRFDIQVKALGAALQPASLDAPTVMGLAPGQPQYQILVVEDQADSRRFLTTLLTNVGFQVWEAINGLEGVQQFTNRQPDAVLMDIRMPIMDGYEATRHMRSLPYGRDVVIIAVTGSVFNEERVAILSEGCDDLIIKPVQSEVLLTKLATYLDVQYTYREDSDANAAAPATELAYATLQSADLQVMPDTWIAQLNLAAVECRDSRIYELIEQIPDNHATLTGSLKHLTDNFEFDTIIHLTDDTV